MEQADDIRILFERYIRGTASEDEVEALAALVEQYDDEALYPVLDEVAMAVKPDPAYGPEYWEAMCSALLQKVRESEVATPAPVRRMHWKRWMVAASVLGLLGLAIWFWRQGATTQHELPAETVAHDVPAPTMNKASITLADGTVVALDSLSHGLLAQQGNTKLVKLADGRVAYQMADGSMSGGEAAYNTLTNPRGSKVIDMTLSDGSHVWLNAGSSVTYPVAFAGNERKISMTGEAYFEIVPLSSRGGAKKSFIVQKGDIQVTVLGTHFNVNAYDDEGSIKITLLEGSVKTSNSFGNVTLRPGQQATITKNQKPETRNNIDLEQVMAWKNGLFSFDNADLPAVMRQLARWYDIEVAYAGKIPEGRFEGKIVRDLSLSQLLSVLSSTRIHYKMEGDRKIIILPE